MKDVTNVKNASQHKIDADAAADPDGGIFGLPHTQAEAELHVLPIPFDATCSYRRGASRGPAAILAASYQVELFDPVAGEPWRRGIHMLAEDPRFHAWNDEAGQLARGVIDVAGRIDGDAKLTEDLARTNAICREVDAAVELAVGVSLDAGKRVLTIGGDHSTALGAICAHAKRHPGMGLLHIDAHGDLRDAYEGFERSHASVIHNVLDPAIGVGLQRGEKQAGTHQLSAVVQVGLRDLCPAEMARISAENRLRAVFDHEWAGIRARGGNLEERIAQAIEGLPNEVYLTLDIDGLEPNLCPRTGTPVPGGLSWHEAWMWISAIPNSGRQLIGADLVEVSPGNATGDTWDAMVGARLALRILGAMA
jgi:agmatinase